MSCPVPPTLRSRVQVASAVVGFAGVPAVPWLSFLSYSLSLSLSPPSLPRSPFSQSAAAAEATSGSLPRFGEVPGTTFTYDDDQEGVISPPLALLLATSAATETSARSKARGQQQTQQRLRPQFFFSSVSITLNALL